MPQVFHYQQFTAPVNLAGDIGTAPPTWLPHPPVQVPPRRPNRNYTTMYEPQPFAATNIDQWQELPWRQYRLRLSNRDNTALTLLPDFWATSPDQWHPSMHRQYRLLTANRDNTDIT